MVKLLVDSGADMFALSEGDPPFATARLSGHDDICELLAPLMEAEQKRDPKTLKLCDSGPDPNVRKETLTDLTCKRL